MKIIILGAGRVGYSVAESLVSERNDITVIDTDASRLADLQERFDLRGVQGNGIDVAVLAEAGAGDTDLLIACAAQDETNLVCCKIAHMVFGIPTRVARVRSNGFAVDDPLMGPDGFAVDAVICPETSVVRYIQKLIDYPEALQVREFAGGRACLSSVRARPKARAVGMRIADLRVHQPDLAMRIVAIYRRYPDEPDRFLRCDGSTRIEPWDEVFVLAATEHVPQVLSAFHQPGQQAAPPVRRILVAGGGVISLQLAQALSAQHGRCIVKIIESDVQRCEQLAAAVPSDVLVLHGSPTDEDIFADENVQATDLFLALTEDDEDNIMACLLAKRMGASRVLALINRRSYADLMHGTQIDIALSPAQAMLGEFLAHVRKGDVQAVHSLRRGVAEALEIVARGDRSTSKVVGRRVEELKLPPEVHIGLIIRGLPDEAAPAEQVTQSTPQVIIPRSHTEIVRNDHVVFFLPNKRWVKDVEHLFRVSATFF